jgi:hypothetical protein
VSIGSWRGRSLVVLQSRRESLLSLSYYVLRSELRGTSLGLLLLLYGGQTFSCYLVICFDRLINISSRLLILPLRCQSCILFLHDRLNDFIYSLVNWAARPTALIKPTINKSALVENVGLWDWWRNPIIKSIPSPLFFFNYLLVDMWRILMRSDSPWCNFFKRWELMRCRIRCFWGWWLVLIPASSLIIIDFRGSCLQLLDSLCFIDYWLITLTN